MKLFSSLLLISVALHAASQAQAVAIVNADFNTIWDNNTNQTPQAYTPATYATGFGSQSMVYFSGGTGPATAFIPGWTTPSSPNVGWQQLQLDSGSTYFDAGEQTGASGYINSGSIVQLLTATLRENSLYTLSVDIGKRKDLGSWTASNYTVELLAGVTSLGLVGVKPNPGFGKFDTGTFTYTSPPSGAIIGQALTIRFSSDTLQVAVDNVVLDTVLVPEPTSVVTLLIGSLGLMPFIRRRR